MPRCRQRAAETEHGLHGTHRARRGQRGQLRTALGDEAVERGCDPIGMLAEELGLVAVHRDVERVEQTENDDERGDGGADTEGGQRRAARSARTLPSGIRRNAVTGQ